MRRIALENTIYLRRRRVAAEARQTLGEARFCLVNYASGATFEEGQRQQNASAASTGEFDFIRAWSRPRIVQSPFYQENRALLDYHRGAGYWLWKPYVIKDAMSFLRDGDFIFYCDTGIYATRSFDYSIYPLCAWIAERPSRIGAVCLRGYANQVWTKRDCFHFMNCDSPAYWNADQIQASYVVLQVNQQTRHFVDDWLEFGRDRRIISDDPNTCGDDNLPGFRDHRHDQSIFANLFLKYGFEYSIDDSANPQNKNVNLSLKHAVSRSANTPTGKLLSSYVASQSSLSNWSRGPDEAASAINAQSSQLYAFHTKFERDPWWMAEFEASSLSEIHIRNRTDGNNHRAATLRVEIRFPSGEWVEIYDAFAARWNCNDPIILEMAGLIATGVRVSLRVEEFFHLHSVGIYLC